MTALIIFLAIFAIARVTRLITTDVIFGGLRDRLYVASSRDDHLVWDGEVPRIAHRHGKLAAFQRFAAKMTSCDWCASIWAAAAIAPLAYFLPFAWFAIPALALTASYLTGLLSAFEGRLYGYEDHEH